MNDIPIAKAQVIWDSGDEKLVPPITVVPIDGQDDRRYSASWGACNSEFTETDDAGRVRMLLSKFVYLVRLYKLDPNDVHTAFSVIPEYRQALDEVGLFDETADDRG